MSAEKTEELTEAQILEYRKKMLSYYEEEMPMLEKQLAYETIIANIEEQRLKRMTWVMKMAQMAAPPAKEEETQKPQ
jgi:hypothetical protein